MAVGFAAAAAEGSNAMLDEWAAVYTWVQLHTGDPGSAGTSNVATETDRDQATWASASGGALTTSAELSWTSVAGSEDYTHFSVWTASSAGTFGGSGTITANAVTAGDNFTIATGDLDITISTAA